MRFANLNLVLVKNLGKWGQQIFLYSLVAYGILGCGSTKNYQIQSLSLSEGELLAADTLVVSFSVTPRDWAAQGYTVHFLLDRDHLRIKKEGSPVGYGNFTDGAHVLIALICDPKSVSLKTPGSVAMRNFYFHQRGQPLVDLQKPLLIVHLPQKTVYHGNENLRILFDFLTINAQLGGGYRIHYNLNGKDYFLNRAKPIWCQEARRIGQHDLTVSLETSDGKLVTGNPFNPMTRSFLAREK